MKKDGYLLKITMTAVMIALICVLTTAVRIPYPTKGYMNLGDCAVLFGGCLLGPVLGTVAGGVGSALADLFAGYPIYIPGTLIIKALMALVVSLVPLQLRKRGKTPRRAGIVIGSAAAELLMVAGYWLYEGAFIEKSFPAALAGVPGNVMQGVVGAAVNCFLAELLSHISFFRLYGAGGSAGGKTN